MEITMNIPMMQDAISEFLKGANELDETKQKIQNLAQMIEDGALVGVAGDEFADALRGPLSSKLTDLAEKFEEIAKDLQAAIDAMEKADTDARGEF